jgi:hypothetical protein
MSQIIDLGMRSCSSVVAASGEASFEFALIRSIQKETGHRSCSWPDGDGNDVVQSILNPESVLDENAPVRLGQRHTGAQFATQNLVFLPQEIVYQGQIAAEKLLNLGDQRIGRILGAAVPRRHHTAVGERREFKRVLRFILKTDEFLHPSGSSLIANKIFGFAEMDMTKGDGSATSCVKNLPKVRKTVTTIWFL